LITLPPPPLHITVKLKNHRHDFASGRPRVSHKCFPYIWVSPVSVSRICASHIQTCFPCLTYVSPVSRNAQLHTATRRDRITIAAPYNRALHGNSPRKFPMICAEADTSRGHPAQWSTQHGHLTQCARKQGTMVFVRRRFSAYQFCFEMPLKCVSQNKTFASSTTNLRRTDCKFETSEPTCKVNETNKRSLFGFKIKKCTKRFSLKVSVCV